MGSTVIDWGGHLAAAVIAHALSVAAAALQQIAPEVLDRDPGTRVMLERLAAGIPGPRVTHP